MNTSGILEDPLNRDNDSMVFFALHGELPSACGCQPIVTSTPVVL